MTRTLRALLVAVVVGMSLVGATTLAEAKPRPVPSSSFVSGTLSGIVLPTFVCVEGSPDPVDVVVESQFQVNAKGLGKGTMNDGPQSVGLESSWFYTLDNGRGSLWGTARLEFWGGAAIMTLSVSGGAGQFLGVTRGALSTMLPLADGSQENLCATPVIAVDYEGVISGVLNYG